MYGKEDRVRDMAAVAERLRTAREARRKFLRLWAIEQAMVEPLVDRVAADLAEEIAGAGGGTLHEPRPQADKG
jgi:hypothetical protein